MTTSSTIGCDGPKRSAASRMAANRLRSRSAAGKARLGDAVEQRVGGWRHGLAAGPLDQLGHRQRLKRGDRQARKPAARRPFSAGVSEKGRWRAPPTKIGTILASAWMAMRATARNSRKDLSVGLDAVGEIDGQPSLALQHAHQPPADEDMLGVEGDGAGKLAPWLEPDRFRRGLVEDMQRLFGQQRQHQRRIDARLVPDRIDDGRRHGAGVADRPVVDAVDELERNVEQRLAKADPQPVGTRCAAVSHSARRPSRIAPVRIMPRLLRAAHPRQLLPAALASKRSGSGAKVNAKPSQDWSNAAPLELIFPSCSPDSATKGAGRSN